MVVRGRLAFDDQGRLVEIAEDAADPTNPQPSEIDPVEVEDLIAQTATAEELTARSEGPYHNVWAFDGADADARFDAALSAVSDGETVRMGAGTYTDDRSITKNIRLVGTGGLFDGNSTMFDEAVVSLNDRCILEGIFTFSTSSFELNDNECRLARSNLNTSNVTVSADRCFLVELSRANINFESGTSDGVVDSCTDTVVTDNGSNTVGDVS